MVVLVHLHTILQRQSPEGLQNLIEVDIPPGTVFLDLLRILEVALDNDQLLLVRNGHIVDENESLRDGDEIHLIPALSGG